MNTRRFLVRPVMLLALVVFIAACAQPSLPQTSATPTVDSAHLTAFARSYPTYPPLPTPTPSPTQLGGASARLGPVPQNCPPGPAPQSIDTAFGPVIGAGPVWAGNFIGPHATLAWLPPVTSAIHNRYGWPHKVLWVVADSFKGLVTIRGANLRDGLSLRPHAEQEVATSTPTTLVLDPQDPNLINHADQWAEFPGSLTIPKAGCYYLIATWPGGSWRITFAAGVVPSNG